MEPRHRIFVAESRLASGNVATVEGDEAHHAIRVKRLRVGDPVGMLDGQGTIAIGAVHAIAPRTPSLEILVDEVRQVDRPTPSLEVVGATPKGRRLDDMIDALAQIGVDAWAPLACARSVVDPRTTKLERIERIARESCKQSGRAWMMSVGRHMQLPDALDTERRVVIADASGSSYKPQAGRDVRVLIGPEGGWTDDELDAARNADAEVVSFGRHTMRIETAAVAAAGVILDAEQNASTRRL